MGLWDPTGILGQNVATASGRIVLDTSGITAARGVVESESRRIGESMRQQIGGGTQSAVQSARASLEQLGTSLRNLGAGIGLVFGALSAGGVSAARSLAQVQSVFRVMLRDEQQVTEQMESLRALADRLHQPFVRMAEGAAALLPIVRSTNAELQRVVVVSSQLLAAAPEKTFEDAAFSIREFFTGDYVSLVERFNLSRTRLHQIREEAHGDVAALVEGLSSYLNELGFTEEALVRVGESGANAFSILRDEAQQLLAQAFGPANRSLNQLAEAVAGFLRSIRETNPQILETAGAFTVVIAAGGAFLAFLGQAISMVSTLNASLRALGVSGGLTTLARIAGGGAAALGGVALGQAIGQQVQPENEAFQGSPGAVAARAITTLFTGLAMAVGKAGEALTELHFIFRAVGLQIQEAFGRALEAIGTFVLGIASLLSRLHIDATGVMKAGLSVLTRGSETRTAAQSGAAGLAAEREAALAGAQAQTETLIQSVSEFFVNLFGGSSALDRFRGEVEETAQAAEEAADELDSFAPTVEQFTDTQVAAWQAFQSDLDRIRANEIQSRIAAEQDAARQRQRQQAEWRLQDDRAAQDERIAAARRAAERAATLEAAQKQHREREKEVIQKANADQLRETAEHEQRLAELQRSLRENVVNAASKLDAVALWNAIRSYNDQAAKENESWQARQKQRDEQVQEQLEAEATAHAERMTQLQQQYAEEDRIRQEDQALRMERLQEDRALQMRAAEEALADRLNQIRTQADAERSARQEAFIAQFNALATHESQMLLIQQQGQQSMEESLRAWWQRMRDSFAVANAVTSATAPSSQVRTRGGLGDAAPRREYQSGGDVWQTGLAGLHAGEYVLNPDTAGMLRTMLGGAITPARLVGAVASGGMVDNSRAISVGNIYGANMESPGSLKQAIREVFSDILDEW